MLLLVPLLGGALTSAAVGTAAVATASWGAAAAPPGAGPTGGPHELQWQGAGAAAVARLDVVATGSLPVTSVTLELDTEGLDGPGAVTLTACTGGDWDGPDCSGVPVPLGDLAEGPVTLVTSLGPGDRVPLRGEAARNVANRTVFRLRVTVGRDAVAPGRVRTG